VKAASVAIPFEEAALLEQCRRGDLSSLGPLIEKYQDRVYNVCWRICGNAEDAADLTQDAFMKSFEAFSKFAGRSGFYTWIFRIAVNLAISHRRKQRLRHCMPLDGDGAADDEGRGSAPLRWLASPEEAPDHRLTQAERHEQVSAALSSLDEEHRTVLVLRDLESFDYQEISEILEIPLGTVKSKLHRARLALKERLGPAFATA